MNVFTVVEALEHHGPSQTFTSALKATNIEASSREIWTKASSPEIGLWLAQRCANAFRLHCTIPFLSVLANASTNDAKAALKRLRADFDEIRHLVVRLAFGFCDWSLTAAFEVAVRIELVSNRDALQDADDECVVTTGDILLELDGPDPRLHGDHMDDQQQEVSPQQPLLRFLERFGADVITMLEEPNGNLLAQRDATLADLHAMGIPQLSVVRRLWIRVAAAAVSAKVQAMGQDLYVPAVDMLIEWKERVVDSFAEVAICNPQLWSGDGGGSQASNERAFRTEWSSRFSDSLLTELGRSRIANFFDMVVDYPDSAPALGDLARCMRRVPSLHRNLIQDARQVLALRLHHAGTRTEDVLAILVSAIRALSALYARGEASAAVGEVCGATLEHLRKRRDAVQVLVRDMTSPPGSGGAQVLQFNKVDMDDAGDDVTPARGTTAGGRSSGHADVLRVLLGALSLPAVIREYRNSLAQTLLAGSEADDGRLDACGEVLERMKCLFGEDVLSQCVVMLRDMETSKRIGTWLAEYWKRPQCRDAAPSRPTRLTIISATCWPAQFVKALPKEETFEPHPTLQAMMQSASAGFKAMKPSQGLKYHLEHGFVSLTFTQQQRQTGRRVETVESLPIALASVVLHISASTPSSCTIDTLAREMKASRAFIEATIQPIVPRLLVVSSGTVSVQQYVVSNESHFEEVQQTDANDPPAFIAPEDLAVFSTMAQAMLKTGGSKTAAQIENSIRMFGKFQGTSTQAKELLLYLANQGKISTADGGATFTITKRP